MKFIKKFFVAASLSIFLMTAPASALLPSISEDAEDYLDLDDDGEVSAADCKESIDILVEVFDKEGLSEYFESGEGEDVESILACGIKSGNIKFWMVPYYVTYMLEFLIGLAGLISVLMIMVGAYFYIAGGISDDKEKGKTIIKYSLLGLIVTSLSWIAVNFLLLLITS